MDINKRIEKIKTYYELSNTEFAERIQVQPSSLSHIFSGRNKPSTEFIIKIKNAFPDLSLDWILLGHGSLENSIMEENIPSSTLPLLTNHNSSNIERIVFFYKNGTFKIYQ